jgi:hypothetical protein
MARMLYQIQSILAEFRGIKEEIKKLDSLPETSSEDWYKRRACQLLNRRIALLLDRLQQIADGDAEV